MAPPLPRTASLLGVAALLALIWFVAPAYAAGPQDASAPEKRASESFQQFAQKWMDNMQEHSQREPVVKNFPAASASTAGAAPSGSTYRRYGTEFTTELRVTGRRATPYVGLLRYTEKTMTCSGAEGQNCSIDSTIPVTEVFLYERGRWVY